MSIIKFILSFYINCFISIKEKLLIIFVIGHKDHSVSTETQKVMQISPLRNCTGRLMNGVKYWLSAENTQIHWIYAYVRKGCYLGQKVLAIYIPLSKYFTGSNHLLRNWRFNFFSAFAGAELLSAPLSSTCCDYGDIHDNQQCVFQTGETIFY